LRIDGHLRIESVMGSLQMRSEVGETRVQAE
jgi:hypothetical protein